MKIFDSTLQRLEHALDIRLTRHGTLSGNLANADTQGFTPVDVDFAASLLAREEGSASASPPPMVVVQAQTSGAGLDGNAVDVDRTLAALAENGLQYSAAAKTAGKKLAILRYVASDGNG